MKSNHQFFRGSSFEQRAREIVKMAHDLQARGSMVTGDPKLGEFGRTLGHDFERAHSWMERACEAAYLASGGTYTLESAASAPDDLTARINAHHARVATHIAEKPSSTPEPVSPEGKLPPKPDVSKLHGLAKTEAIFRWKSEVNAAKQKLKNRN
jgi:hypothetical protein